MIKKLLARFLRKEPKTTICIGCQQAMQRINNGAQTAHCQVCGCAWLSKAAARDSYVHYQRAHKIKTQAEFDAQFSEDVRPFRESAEKAGCDMAAFDMEIAVRKARVDEFRANAQHFYQQRIGTPF